MSTTSPTLSCIQSFNCRHLHDQRQVTNKHHQRYHWEKPDFNHHLHDQRQVRLILSGVGDKVTALLFASHRERFERRRGWWCCFL